MQAAEVRRIEAELGGAVVANRTLAGGFSHETCLLTLTGGDRSWYGSADRTLGSRPR